MLATLLSTLHFVVLIDYHKIYKWNKLICIAFHSNNNHSKEAQNLVCNLSKLEILKEERVKSIDHDRASTVVRTMYIINQQHNNGAQWHQTF